MKRPFQLANMTPPVSVEGNYQQVPLMEKILQMTMAVAVRLGTVSIARMFGKTSQAVVGVLLLTMNGAVIPGAMST